MVEKKVLMTVVEMEVMKVARMAVKKDEMMAAASAAMKAGPKVGLSEVRKVCCKVEAKVEMKELLMVVR
jgi:hypothetical protein